MLEPGVQFGLDVRRRDDREVTANDPIRLLDRETRVVSRYASEFFSMSTLFSLIASWTLQPNVRENWRSMVAFVATQTQTRKLRFISGS